MADTDGKPAHLVGYQWDISEQKQAAEIQANLQRELQEAQNMHALCKLVAGAPSNWCAASRRWRSTSLPRSGA